MNGAALPFPHIVKAERQAAPTLAERVARLFVDRLNTEVPTADTDLFETGILDSLRFVDLLVALEDAFGVRVTIAEIDIDDFRTVSRMAAFLAAKRP